MLGAQGAVGTKPSGRVGVTAVERSLRGLVPGGRPGRVFHAQGMVRAKAWRHERPWHVLEKTSTRGRGCQGKEWEEGKAEVRLRRAGPLAWQVEGFVLRSKGDLEMLNKGRTNSAPVVGIRLGHGAGWKGSSAGLVHLCRQETRPEGTRWPGKRGSRD